MPVRAMAFNLDSQACCRLLNLSAHLPPQIDAAQVHARRRDPAPAPALALQLLLPSCPEDAMAMRRGCPIHAMATCAGRTRNAVCTAHLMYD